LARGDVIPTPLSQRTEDLRRQVLPVVTWLGAVVLVSWMLMGSPPPLEAVGFARPQQQTLSTSRGGLIIDVAVDLHERVEAGQVLARLDDTALLAELAVARADIVRLSAEVEAERARVIGEGRSLDGLRVRADAARMALDALAHRVDLATDVLEHERLSLQLSREESLYAEGLLPNEDREDLVLLIAQSAARVETGTRLVEVSEVEAADLAEALAGRSEDESVDARLLVPLHEAVAVQRRRVDALEAQRVDLLVRAPATGSVADVLVNVGRAVTPGQPLIRVVSEQPRDVVVWFPEAGGLELTPDTPVRVARRAQISESASATVTRVGAAVEQLPARLWRDPAVPEYGRSLLVSLPDDLDLVPGEAVLVSAGR
jgi:multidrug resistance efflux pump